MLRSPVGAYRSNALLPQFVRVRVVVASSYQMNVCNEKETTLFNHYHGVIIYVFDHLWVRMCASISLSNEVYVIRVIEYYLWVRVRVELIAWVLMVFVHNHTQVKSGAASLHTLKPHRALHHLRQSVCA